MPSASPSRALRVLEVLQGERVIRPVRAPQRHGDVLAVLGRRRQLRRAWRASKLVRYSISSRPYVGMTSSRSVTGSGPSPA